MRTSQEPSYEAVVTGPVIYGETANSSVLDKIRLTCMYIMSIMHTMDGNDGGVLMKTFSTTDAKNRFGEFVDTGMVERVKLIRNNRVVGYFLPEREYNELTSAMIARIERPEPQTRLLTEAQEETLALYSQGQVGASEAKADAGCNYRELISMLAERGLALPHVDLALAEKMATEALALMNIPVSQQDHEHRSIHRG